MSKGKPTDKVQELTEKLDLALKENKELKILAETAIDALKSKEAGVKEEASASFLHAQKLRAEDERRKKELKVIHSWYEIEENKRNPEKSKIFFVYRKNNGNQYQEYVGRTKSENEKKFIQTMKKEGRLNMPTELVEADKRRMQAS